MNKILILAFKFTLVAYSILCAVVVASTPLNKFEWMLDDALLKAERLTFCTLPLDDGGAPIVPFLFILPLLVFSMVASARKRQMHYALWISVGLVLFWALRFFVLYPSCS